MLDINAKKYFFILKNTKIIKKNKNYNYNLNVCKSTSSNKLIKSLINVPLIVDLRSKFGPVCDQ